MAKYNIIELKIKDGILTDLGTKSNEEQKALKIQNAVYIYRSTKTKKIYIGQTIHFIDRHKQHYSGTEEKFNTANFDRVIVIFSVYFNRSALDDVESQLITYFAADSAKNSGGSVQFDNDEVINRTGGNSVNEYESREKVASEVILPLWEHVLYPNGWVSMNTIEELRTKELVKYSPIKMLTSEQGQLIGEIVGNPDKSYVINGDAGTGKTVLLTHLAAALLKDRPNARIGIIVQPNWEKTGAKIFKVYGMNSSRLSVMTSTKFISENEEYDIIIVDESHKLSRKYGKQHPSFNLVYTNKFAGCRSHLEIIQKLGSQIILSIDLNKVGVLIGNDLKVDENGKLAADSNNFYNTNGIFTKEEMEDENNRFEFTLFVLNIYYVLLTRGIDGIRLGFWKNDKFREYMEKTLDIK